MLVEIETMLSRGGIPTQLAARILVSESGCWVWARPLNSYGYAMYGRPKRFVHRVTYEVVNGPIAPGLEIDHLCRIRNCVNPAHLEAVTHQENVARSPITQQKVNALKTHCPSGHPYDDANTYLYTYANRTRPVTTRACRACTREAQRRYRARKRAAQW